MNRRSRLLRRLPFLRTARHRRERHEAAGAAPERGSSSPFPAFDWETWGAAAAELGLVPEPDLRPNARRA